MQTCHLRNVPSQFIISSDPADRRTLRHALRRRRRLLSIVSKEMQRCSATAAAKLNKVLNSEQIKNTFNEWILYFSQMYGTHHVIWDMGAG